MNELNRKRYSQRIIPGELIKIIELKELQTHDVIYSVARGLDGRIYFAPSSENYPGSSARIYCLEPKTECLEEVVNVADLEQNKLGDVKPGHSKIHVSMVVGNNGSIYAATHVTAPPRNSKFAGFYETFNDPYRGYPGSIVIAYHPEVGKAENLGCAAPHEGVRAMTIDKTREILYMITFPRSHLVKFDIKKRIANDLGRISMENPLGIECNSRGIVFTTDDEGFIIRYDPDKDEIEKLSIRIPDAPWRNGRANYVRRLKVDPNGDSIWGFGTKSVRLFEYNTTVGSEGVMVDHGIFVGEDYYGKWGQLLAAKAMAFGADDRLYISFSHDEGVVGQPECRICSFDPKTKVKRDFGIMRGENLPPIVATLDAAGGLDGKIYWGTREGISPPQIAIFTPPIDSMLDSLSDVIDGHIRDVSSIEEDMWSVKKIEKIDKEQIVLKAKKTSPFVQEGSVTLRELGWSKLGLLIPDGENRITSLVRSENGKIYGITSGKRAHLFVYNPLSTSELKENPETCPLEIRVIEDQLTYCNSLASVSSGKIYIGTLRGNGIGPIGGDLYEYDPSREYEMWEEHGLPRRPFPFEASNPLIKKLDNVTDGKGVARLTADSNRQIIYLITSQGANFIAYSTIDNKILLKEKISIPSLYSSLVCDSSGNVYWSDDAGLLCRFNIENQLFENLGVKIPAQKGRDYLNTTDSFSIGHDGLIYGGTREGFLFSFNPSSIELRSIGKPTMLERIPCLCTGNDGTIFGISGSSEDIAKLFKYDPLEEDLRDLGILQVGGIPKFWVGHKFASMVCGLNGEIYIGEDDRMSHLFIYYPRIKGIEEIVNYKWTKSNPMQE
jgi:outer membrane protein assembly factor BamB